MARTYWNEKASLGICIDWFGPYKTFKKFKSDIECEDVGTKVLYFAECKKGSPIYVGLTEKASGRFNNHPIMQGLGENDSANYWFGVINSQGKSGRRTKKENTRKSTAADLDQAERALINWLSPKRNKQKITSHPGQTVSIYNRFFTKKKANPRRGPKSLPTLLLYNWISDEYTSVFHKRSGKL